MSTSVKSEVVTEFRATGVENVRRGLKLVGDDGNKMAGRLGSAASTAASGLEQITRTGQASGDAIKTIISQGANMAFMFGAAGPIVGALGIGALAIFNFFDRARKEMEETRRKFQSELAQIARAGDLAKAASLVQQQFSGDAAAAIEGKRQGESDAQFFARQHGLKGVRQEITRLDRTPEVQAVSAAAKNPGPDGTALRIAIIQAGKLLEMRDALKKLEPELASQYAKTNTVLQELTKSEQERTDLLIRRGKDKDAGKALNTEIAGLSALQKINALRASDIKRARELEAGLTDELLHGNASRERRIVLEKQLRDLALVANIGRQNMAGQGLNAADVLGKRATTDIFEQLFAKPDGVKATGIEKVAEEMHRRAQRSMSEAMRAIEAEVADAEERLEKLKAGLHDTVNGFGQTIGGAMSDAFATAFSTGSISGVFKSFGDAVLAGLGSMLQQQGALYLTYGGIMKSLVPGLFNPLSAGANATAIGLALLAMGGALQGLAHKGGGVTGGFSGGTFASSPAQIIDRGLINPAAGMTNRASQVMPRNNVTNHVTVIGPDDPQAQRALAVLLGKAGRR